MAETDEPNKLPDLKKYLSTPDNPVSTQEMQEFWLSLTDEEKEEFRNAKLPKSE